MNEGQGQVVCLGERGVCGGEAEKFQLSSFWPVV